LEYLDTNENESDTDDTSEEEDVPHVTSPAAQPVSDSEDDNMDDENYREIL
jgi:hypothetical protein